VFGAGAGPGSAPLLAHELAHTLQSPAAGAVPTGLRISPNNSPAETVARAAESAPSRPAREPGGAGELQRQKKKGGSPAPKPKPPAAKDAPKLDVTPSKNGPPCACLLVIHNDEQNARATAGLMHAHCSYNLALVQPDGGRRIRLPGHKNTVDPNELFSPDVVRQCTDDEKSCTDFLAGHAESSTPAEIERFVQISFFLAVKHCSQSFSLPVIALHNNAIDDTVTYRADKDKKGVADLKLDIDKTDPEQGAKQVEQLKKLLEEKFGKAARKTMTETKGKTNIFRWCASNDLAKCHIGDPDHPDNVTWVTNEADFNKLKSEPVNVALQSSVVAGGESATDLSTVFVVLQQLFAEHTREFLERAAAAPSQWEMLWWLMEAVRAAAQHDRTRFVNVETPGLALNAQTDAERIRNYEAILAVLKPLGLHCCPDPTAAEGHIKEGLKIDERKPKEAKKKKP
jgi:hypothetical protein